MDDDDPTRLKGPARVAAVGGRRYRQFKRKLSRYRFGNRAYLRLSSISEMFVSMVISVDGALVGLHSRCCVSAFFACAWCDLAPDSLLGDVQLSDFGKTFVCSMQCRSVCALNGRYN